LTDTAFFDASGTRRQYAGNTPSWVWQRPETVARAGARAVERNRPVCVPGPLYQALVGFFRAAPSGMARAAIRNQAWRFDGASQGREQAGRELEGL
jgi:short-subunit dehydrogenase